MGEPDQERAEVTTGLTELAALLLSVEDAEEALHHLARMAVIVIPDGPSCGITMVRDGRPTTMVYEGPVPAAVDEFQYAHGDGPCLDALRTRRPVVVQDLSTAHRWSEFATAALASGAHGVYAHPLEVAGEVVGTINLYAHRPDIFPEPVQRIAAQFVEPAAVLLGGVLRRLDQAKLIAELRAALSSRTVIDQAMGVIMARRRCGPEQAFGVLRKMSNDRNVKLREIAADIVQSVTRPGDVRPPHRDLDTER